MRRLVSILFWLWCLSVTAAEVIPPKPPAYFNDYAGVVDSGTANRLNRQLEDFEKTSGNQVVVAVYKTMQSDSSIDDYTVRVARAWRAGLKGTNNGVVLFVYTDDRRMFIQVGYGLEGALPDATCKQITEYEIKPYFKAGDYAGGLTAGINAIIAATRGEFKGRGTTVNQGRRQSLPPNLVFIIVVIIFILLSIFSRGRRGGGWIIGGGGWGGYSGGGGWGGGGGGGGGGGFSGGGGSFGGGGAGSSW